MRRSFALAITVLAASVGAPAAPAAQPWTKPVSLVARDVAPDAPTLSVNAKGDALVRWSTRDGLLVASRPAGGRWSSPVAVDSGAIALDDEGRLAVLAMGSGGGVTLRAARVGGRFGPPRRITPAGVFIHYPFPEIAPAGGGLVLAYTVDGRGLVIQRRDRRGRLGAAHDVGRDVHSDVLRVAGNRRGDAAVAWEDVPGGGRPIFYDDYREEGVFAPAGRAFGAPEPIAGTYYGIDQLRVGTRGHVVLLGQALGNATGGFLSVRRPGGTFTAPSGFLGAGPGDLDERTVSVGPNGDIAVGLRDGIGAGAATVRRATGEMLVDRAVGPALEAPRTVYDEHGVLMAFWPGTDGALHYLRGASPSQVGVAREGRVRGTAFALDAAGDGIAVWLRGDHDAKREIRSAIYDVNPPKIDALVAPSRLRAGRAGRFAVVAADGGSGVKRIEWSFGARGATVRHAFARPGRHVVRVRVVDAVGHATVARRSVRVIR